MVDYVISLEGRTMTTEQREYEVRQKVKGILPIDVTSEQPLGCDYDGGKFDIIIASYCFEAAARDVGGYIKCIENVSRLLNKGGHLIIGVCLEGGRYQVGEYIYPGVTITKEQVDVAMAQTGYDVITSVESQGTTVDDKYLDVKSYYFIVGSN